jgi:spoIIIJ-associated protein
MEWVETTGKTLAEAKDAALDQLGVHEEDAEFDILEEPQQGLFGRVRGEARVRARVRPAQARQKVDRRDRKRAERAEKNDKSETTRSRGTTPTSSGITDVVDAAPISKAAKRPAKSAAKNVAKSPAKSPIKNSAKNPEGEHTVDAGQVGEEARRFVDALVSAFRLSGTTELISDGDDLEIRVHGQELGLLVGPRGTTLQAVQDLTRVASQRRLGDHDTRLRVDVGGYRERRRAALGTFATQMAQEVIASGVARVLEPMSSADRKVIHDTLATVEDISTRSEGDDPYRRVVIAPANA